MRRSIRRAALPFLDSASVQYVCGALANLLLLWVLVSCETSLWNIQLHEGLYVHNQADPDNMTYVQPARNFLHNGIFGYDLVPDYHRTIGYPAFLAAVMRVFGERNFPFSVYLIQSLLFPLAYPLLTGISRLLFPTNRFVRLAVFAGSLLSGAYLATTHALMTDLFFAVLLLTGVFFGFLAMKKGSTVWILLQITVMACAAQVRPTLGLYFLVNMLLLLAFLKAYGDIRAPKLIVLVILSTVGIAVVGNLPAARNYCNYGVFVPADGLADNLFTYLAKRTLESEGEGERFAKLSEEVNKAHDLKDILQIKEKVSFDVVKQHPLAAAKVIAEYAGVGLLAVHGIYIANYFGYSHKDKVRKDQDPLKKSNLVYAVMLVYIALTLAMYWFFLLFLRRLLRMREFLTLFALLAFIAYFFLPTCIAGGGPRMRLPVEGVFLIFASVELGRTLRRRKRTRAAASSFPPLAGQSGAPLMPG